MNLSPEEEQDRILTKSLKKIKEQTYFINNNINKNNLRQCLKESYILLSELRTNSLTPRKYYHLYISAFDVMLNIKNYMAEEIGRGRRLIDLYDNVQQAKHVIPRLYLMITAGSIYMEKVPRSVHVILFDMLGIVKQAQNPIKGLFIRNYLLKMTKDKLPDKDNVYVREGGTFEDTLKFLLQNLEEMNRLWIRLLIGVSGQAKVERQKEREELKILVGESISKLSSLESLTQEIYEQQVLPKLLKIIVDSKDVLSQQYLMECIIHSFPNSYNIKCMEMILDTMTQLVEGVDISVLFMELMGKIGKYFGENIKKKDNAINDYELYDILESAQKIYPVLLNNFETIINANIKGDDNKSKEKNTKNSISNMSLIKLLDLISSFMNFSIQSSPEEHKFMAVEKILSYIVQIVKRFYITYSLDKKELREEERKKITEILLAPLEGNISIFSINDYYKLMEYLDFKRKKNIGINIINKLINYDSFKNLDSIDKLQQLIKFIQPLLSDSKNKNEQTEDEAIEKEQNIVCKVLFIVNSSDPEIMYEIYNQFKNIFSYGGPRRRKYTLPTLVNTIISFCHKMTICYANQKNKLPDFLKVNEKKLNNLVNYMDLGKISNDETFTKLMLNVYKLLNEAITLVAQEIPELALKLYSSAATQVNEILVEQEKFSDICLNYINSALAILDEGKYSQNIKVELIEDICSNLMKCSILSNEHKEEIIQKLINSSESIEKREDQFRVMLIISQLYYTIFKDGQKVIDSMNKARRYADFAMTNSRNLSLFVELLNKYLYFVDKADDVVDIKKEKIEDIIELIRGHIRTIKNVPGEDDISYLDSIELYFNNTIKLIQKRKDDESNEKLKEFYQSINL
mgnify:CR=1 FL=1